MTTQEIIATENAKRTQSGRDPIDPRCRCVEAGIAAHGACNASIIDIYGGKCPSTMSIEESLIADGCGMTDDEYFGS